MKNKKESIFKINELFKLNSEQEKCINEICNGISIHNYDKQTLHGVTGSGKTYTIANIINKLNRNSLIIAHNKTLAAQLYFDMKQFFPNNYVGYFISYFDYYQPEAYIPSTDIYIEKSTIINNYIEQLRNSTIESLITGKNVIIIATVAAIYNIGNPNIFRNSFFELNIGKKISYNEIIEKLISLNYTRNDEHFNKSNFRCRGDIIDINLYRAEDISIRIKISNSYIIELSEFNQFTGRFIKNINNIIIYSKSLYIINKKKISEIIKLIRNDLKKQLELFKKKKMNIEYNRLKSKIEYDIEMLNENNYCNGIENYTYYLDDRNIGEKPYTLINYMKDDSLIFVDESHITLPQIKSMYYGDKSRKSTLIEYGFRLPTCLENRPLTFNEFITQQNKMIFISATPGIYEINCSKSISKLFIRPTGIIEPKIEISPCSNQIQNSLNEIKKILNKRSNKKILISTITKKLSEKITYFLNEKNIKAKYIHSDLNTVERTKILYQLRNNEYDVIVGVNLMREGIDIPEIALILIFDADKEGFLRSETSLIQLIGRASRNIDGKVILYANNITKSIKKTINEINNRREYQIKYNKNNNIIPQNINKKIENFELYKNEKELCVLNNNKNDTNKILEKLKDDLNIMVKNLNFESAIDIRNKITQIKKFLKKI